MMGRKKESIIRPIWYTIVCFCLGICMIPLTLYADESRKVMQTLTDNNVIKIYVRGGMEGEATYQIGNIPTESPKIYGIEEDSQPMRTMILIDNSLSIPKNSRGKVLEAVKAILSGHGGKEEFCLATFDEEIRYLTGGYSTDYTALLNLVDSIHYENLETAATNVLYYLLKELDEEAYPGYTRIVVISDGVDDKPLGEADRDELYKLLETSSYPIYTIGCNTGDNSDQLSSLFSLSRLTGCEYCILEDTGIEEIGNLLGLDKEIIVYEVTVPEKAGIGGSQSSKLTLSDGTVLNFDVTVPFYIVDDIVPAGEVKKDEEAKADIGETEILGDTIDSDKEEPKNNFMGFLIPALIALLLLLCIALVSWFLKKRKRVIPNDPPGNYVPPKQEVPSYGGKTVLLSKEVHKRDTQIVTPGNLENNFIKSYQLTLTDQKNQQRSFGCTFQHEVLIGRNPDNQIIINDDTVSGAHCRILCRNGVFYIEDRGSQNKTFVNGNSEPIQFETLIVSGSTVKIGMAEYQISIKEL